MHVFSKILKGRARFDFYSKDNSKHEVVIAKEGDVLITDEILNLHEISAIEEVSHSN